MASLPKPVLNQPHQDMAKVSADRLRLNTEYLKKSAICKSKAAELEEELESREEARWKEVEEALKIHEARLDAIASQHAIQLADTLARQAANMARCANLDASIRSCKRS